MKASLVVSKPVVTFLSPSPVASRRAADRLAQWSTSFRHLPPVNAPVMAAGMNWDTVALQCSSSHTILQWLAPARATREDIPHSLLAVQRSNLDQELRETQQRLWKELESTMSRPKLMLSGLLRWSVLLKHLLGASLLPVVDLRYEDAERRPFSAPVEGLKELAIPFSEESTYLDGEKFISKLSTLPSPVTGLYQLDRLRLRPLPGALDDRILPPPSIILHSSELPNSVGEETSVSKIGFTGTGKGGQVMLRHDDVKGLDVRLCSSNSLSSMFAEAHESLLAGSLSQLQSAYVEGSSGQIDPKTNQTDCWIEFRTTMTNPSGYWRSKKARIAKPPDLPYE